MKEIKKNTRISIIFVCTILTGAFISASALGQQPDNPNHPETKSLLVLVNQVGYDANGEKILVVQLRDTPNRLPAPDFQIIDTNGRPVFSGKLIDHGRINAGTQSDWGARYWTGDFTALKTPGEYQARVQSCTEVYSSFQFRIGDNIIFNQTIYPVFRFFWYQRCGFAVPGLHIRCHLDDARVPYTLGEHRTVTGGYHNAGDLNKYANVSCRSVYAIYVLARQASGLGLPDSVRKQIVDEGLWGSEFLLKMWIPGKGMIYQEVWNGYEYWGRSDLETDNIPGTPDDRPLRGTAPSAMSACALAAAARETGRSDFRKAAEELWKTAVDSLPVDMEEAWVMTSGGFPNRGEDISGRLVRRTADLLLADLELEALTGDNRYTSSAQLHAESIIKYQKADGIWPSDIYSRFAYQGVPPAALALYVKSHPNTKTAVIAVNTLRLWMDRKVRLADNPFNLIPWEEGTFFNPDMGSWCYIGQNSQYLSNAWAMYLTAPLIRDNKAINLADRQFNWILGLNPYSLCMVEGKGGFNSPFYLHRWAPNEARGAVPGAVPNGFCRVSPDKDIPWFDLYTSPQRVSYHTSEPWEPHSTFYILAATARAGLQKK